MTSRATSGTATANPAAMFSATDDSRRAKILDAALAVFAEKGYDGGTMRDIAARVGVTEPALYRHFASKEDLFLTLMRGVASRMLAETGALLDDVDPADVRRSIERIFADRRNALRVYAPALRTIIAAVAHSPVFLEAYRDAIAVPMREKVAAVVARVDDHYGIARTRAETAARVRTLMSIAVGAMVTSVVLGDEPDSATADAVVRVMGWERPKS